MDKEIKEVQLIIPTLNGESYMHSLLDSIQYQKEVKIKLLIIDSGSHDRTLKIAKNYSCKIYSIKRSTFDHGGTRQLGINLCPNAEIIIFMTQDAILANEYAIRNILRCFNDNLVGCAYGRQLPHEDADIFAAHARFFNYPVSHQEKSRKDILRMGMRVAFISNSFAAYRKKALEDVGGFPLHMIFGEDTYVAAKMILDGWKNFYCADAKVYHSHNYTIYQTFKRYFDIGIFHAREKWLRKSFGEAEKTGIEFVLSEMRCVVKHDVFLLFKLFVSIGAKFIAYRLGLIEQVLPRVIKCKLSMNNHYWESRSD